MKRKPSPKRPRTFREVVMRARRLHFGPEPMKIRDILVALSVEGTRAEIQLVSARTLTGPIMKVGDVVVMIDDKRHGLVVFPLAAIASIMREPKR